jgi:putative nucleotidyltransferase with HDIG domain
METFKTKIQNKNVITLVGVILFFTIFCNLVGFSLIIPLVVLYFGCHIFLFKKANLHLFLCLGLLLTVLLCATNAVIEYTDIHVLYIPVASIAMLTMLLFNDLQLAFLMSFAGSVIVSLLLNADLNIMLTCFVGSLTASYTVRNARTRARLISAGFYVGLMQLVCVALVNPDPYFLISKTFALEYLRPLFIGGLMAAFITMGTLKIFEFFFGVITNFSLLELSDFNQSLLKRMILEAPGTYHHSIVVSNLAETAADAIGANALLTRVGAYYHDIGKVEKPEYFTENQIVGGNKHDNIEPSMSRLVILKHVKEGIELAKKSKLSSMIIDFIPQHHGTSLMHYFYQKALEEAEDHSSVKEDNYRYPGPKPQTRETAIVLLADSVEAATRCLDEANPKKIEEVVRKIINNKFIDGQLDECNLTLKEIELIARTFTHTLGAMYHARIRYPEKKNGDSRNNKPAEENSSESRQDSQDS